MKLYTDYMGVHFAMSGRSFFEWMLGILRTCIISSCLEGMGLFE